MYNYEFGKLAVIRPQVLSFQSLHQVMGRNTSKVKKFLIQQVVYSQCFQIGVSPSSGITVSSKVRKSMVFHGVCFRFKIERNRRLSVCSWCSYSSCSLPLNATLHGTSTTKGTAQIWHDFVRFILLSSAWSIDFPRAPGASYFPKHYPSSAPKSQSG